MFVICNKRKTPVDSQLHQVQSRYLAKFQEIFCCINEKKTNEVRKLLWDACLQLSGYILHWSKYL